MQPHDSGPIYRETLMGRLPVEPWNTWSNLVFLFVALFWAWHVYRAPQRHRFLAFALPVLFIGFVGGTVYHGTRSHEAWLLMDWVPIVVLTTACMALFARRAGLAWPWVVLLFAAPFVVRYFMLRSAFSPTVVMNTGYAAMGVMVLLPILLHLRRNNFVHWRWLATSVGLFALAVTFRSLDHHESMRWMPMGTHWLWHAGGASAVFFILGYIWLDDRRLAKAS